MNKEEFIEIYAPCKQYLYSMHEDRCHNGKAPTLREVCTLYGADFAMQWVANLIDDLQGFTSAKTRLNDNQRNTLAAIVCTQYRRMKATELLLFLVKAKAGQFGKFYNTIDPMDISTALAAWSKECERIKSEHLYQQEQERQEQERDKHLGECISIEEAIKRGIVKNPLLRKYFSKE